MIELKTSLDGAGTVLVAEEVISIIAGTAAMEVEGVTAAGNFTGEIAEILGKKNLSKGVKLSVNDNAVSIEINIQVQFGYKIKEVSEEVQRKVKNAVETMVGLSAPEVNINVSGVLFEKDKKAAEGDA